MQEGKKYLTKEKYEELAQELNELKTVTRKEIAEQLQYARSLGDLSENAEYHEARDGQAKIESRISELENILKNAEILKHKIGDVADVGSIVVLKKIKENETHEYEIVGPEESDITKGKISYESPLGAALIDKKKGEEFSFKSPKGNIKYQVLDLKYY